MAKIIEVIVSPKGEVKIETKGFAGTQCRAASKALEEALGVRASEQLTAEFYQPVQSDQSIKASQQPEAKMSSTPRRRILRLPLETTTRNAEQISRRRAKLDQERTRLARWMARLKRAFHALEKGQRRVAALERQIARLERD